MKSLAPPSTRPAVSNSVPPRLARTQPWPRSSRWFRTRWAARRRLPGWWTLARYFVPAVMIIAVLTLLIWFNFGPSPALAFGIVSAVTVSIIACPCAVGMAVPMSLVAGVGKAAEHGVLIRNGEALQVASQLKTVVLDKTGTITKGEPKLTDTVPALGFDEDALLRYAAATDRLSEHPLAQAIVAGAQARGLALATVSSMLCPATAWKR